MEQNNSEVVEQKPANLASRYNEIPVPDYDQPIVVGQYWIDNGLNPLFIVECNQYGVIFQTNVSLGNNEEVVFDFESGQNLLTSDAFKQLLIRREAKQLVVSDKLVNLSLEVYKKKRAEGLIQKVKVLPRNEKEYFDLKDIEVFDQLKRICAPPRKYRNKKGFHWLNAGTNGDITVCKLWDPDLENWVTLSGEIDESAMIGFIKSYREPIQTKFTNYSAETFEDLTNRFIHFLRQCGFMFDEKYITEKFGLFNPLILNGRTVLTETEITEINEKESLHTCQLSGVIPPLGCLAVDSELKIIKLDPTVLRFKEYEFSYVISDKQVEQENQVKDRVLQINFANNGRIEFTLIFMSIKNDEFIPKTKIGIEFHSYLS